MAINGAPIFQPIFLGSFDALGEFVIAGPAPSQVSGLNITFQSIGFGKISAKAVPTNEETVAFQ